MKKIVLFLLLGLIFLGGLSFVYLLHAKRKEISSYDRLKDYHYTFHNADIVNLELKEGKLTLSSNLDEKATTFLKIKILSTFMGNFLPPFVKIKTKDKVAYDYFEYGGSGWRYINLSSLIKGTDKEIELEANYLNIADTKVELITYNNHLKADAKILVVSPHPDDAEIAAFGLYSDFPNSFVLTVTSGENGPMDYDELFEDSLSHYLKKGQIRTINSISVPLFAGLNQDKILNLGYFDGTLKKMYDKNPSIVPSQTLKTDEIKTFRQLNVSNLKDSLKGVSNWNSLVQNIQFILESYKPDITVLPHPQMDSHSDHQYTTFAVIQAIKRAQIHSGELFFYSNHHFSTEFFPFGKAGGTVSLPPNINDEYYFHSIYSHPLSREKQMEKILALDAMNDLRPDTEWRFWDQLLKLSYEHLKAAVKGQQNSYFKRAIRSNELFFVVPTHEIFKEETIKKLQFGKNFTEK